ncbi:MAG: carbohydrate ABC transporter permease, partial [Brachybacterium sp.]
MSTTDIDETTTGRRKPLGNAAKAARGDGRAGARDAGRKPTTTIIITALLAIVALYFLVPVYWVVINATKSTEDL